MGKSIFESSVAGSTDLRGFTPMAQMQKCVEHFTIGVHVQEYNRAFVTSNCGSTVYITPLLF